MYNKILKMVFFVPCVIYKVGEHAYQNPDAYRRAGAALKNGALALPGAARALPGLVIEKTINLASGAGNAYLNYKKITIPFTLTGVSPVSYGGYQGYMAPEGQGVEAFVGNTSMVYQSVWSHVSWGRSKTGEVANAGVNVVVDAVGTVVGESTGYVAEKTGNFAVKVVTPLVRAGVQVLVDGAIETGREFIDLVVKNTPKSLAEVRDLCYTAPENRQGGAEKLIEQATDLTTWIKTNASDPNNLPGITTVVLTATAVATAVGLGYAAYRYKKSIEKVEGVAAGVITPAKPETPPPSDLDVSIKTTEDGDNVESSVPKIDVSGVETTPASISTSTPVDEATATADEPIFSKKRKNLE